MGTVGRGRRKGLWKVRRTSLLRSSGSQQVSFGVPFIPHRVPLNFVLVPLRGWRADRRGLPNAGGVSFPSSGSFDGVTY